LAREVGLLARHRGDDPRRVVGLEESGVDEGSEPVAGLVVHAHGHRESDVDGVRDMREAPRQPDEVLLAEQDLPAVFVELRIDLGQVAWRRRREGFTLERAFERDRFVELCGWISELAHRGVDVGGSADRLHQHRRRSVVGNDDHEPRQVVERRLEPVGEESQHPGTDVAVRRVETDSRRRLDRSRGDQSRVVQENARLHRALGREDSVGIDLDRLVRAEVAGVDAEAAGPPG